MLRTQPALALTAGPSDNSVSGQDFVQRQAILGSTREAEVTFRLPVRGRDTAICDPSACSFFSHKNLTLLWPPKGL